MTMASDYLGGTKTPSPLINRAGIYNLYPAYIASDNLTKNGDNMTSVCWETDDGKSVWDNMAIIEKAAFRWAQLWFALGEEDQDFPSVDDMAQACLNKLQFGARIYARVVMEPYRGNKLEYKDTKVPSIEKMLPPQEGETIIGPQQKPIEESPF